MPRTVKKRSPNKKLHDYVNSLFPKCKKGQILRNGYAYKRKDGKLIVVPPICIKDRGLKGKGKKLFTLKKGILKKYGYSNVKSLTIAERRTALKRAEKHISALSLFRKLNAVALLNKNTNPRVSRIFKSDASWVKRTYGV